jgi:secreted trypsin-like serine protease
MAILIVCGIKPEAQGRIVGGETATPFEFPWLAALVFKGTREEFCGGSLINGLKNMQIGRLN